MKLLNTTGNVQEVETEKGFDLSRRRFFQLAGGITGAGLVLSACRTTPPSTTYVGSGDAGLLNMMYIVEQVQAGFYTQAAITPYYGITTSESSCFIDLRDQAIAHSEYLAALLGTNAAKPIVLNLSLAIFADRTSTLANAYGIADLAVGGYNGAARLQQDRYRTSSPKRLYARYAELQFFCRCISRRQQWTGPGNGAGQRNGRHRAVHPDKIRHKQITFFLIIRS